MSKKYTISQRWYSEAEPELGLGVITQVEGKVLQILFTNSHEIRTYGVQTAPLKRFALEVGDEVQTEEYQGIIVEIIEKDGLLTYMTKEAPIPEALITAQIKISNPIERFSILNFDSPQFFNLRYQSYLAYRNYETFTHKGFLGVKVNLLPHQLFIAQETLAMENPKVMLCDEVGLGKTIETGIITHSFLQRDLVQNIIIIVPDSLVNQWFVEFYKKFSINFVILNEYMEDEVDFSVAQKYIIGKNQLSNNEKLQTTINEISWDLLIIDESHQIPFTNSDNPLTKIIRNINSKTYSTILLSATPEVLGQEFFFAQLNFLDPDRYTSFDEFSLQYDKQKSVSQFIKNYLKDETSLAAITESNLLPSVEAAKIKDKESAIEKIIDRHGQGRCYFRNSRSNLEKYQSLFTKRELNAYPINAPKIINDKSVIKTKLEILVNIFDKFSTEKILVICHSKELVLSLNKMLLSIANYKLALFHSDQSLIERDRQAAYFADPEGARILICTEIGSEGRNFEFAHHLVLFDLPKVPDQLEQRIGRLDRIGQKNNVQIHIPYILTTFEEKIFLFYNNVLNAFRQFPKSASGFYQRNKEDLIEFFTTQSSIKQTDKYIEQLTHDYEKYSQKFEEGRDVLLEFRSYNDSTAQKIKNTIEDFEAQKPVKQYLENVFNEIGINFEELNNDSYFVSPSHNMLIPVFAGLENEGKSYTYSRSYSQKHDNIDLLTWEHPITKTAFDLILKSTLGNLSIVCTDRLPRNIYFEFIVTLQTSDEHRHIASTFLPFTPLRVFLDVNLEDQTMKFPKKQLDQIEFIKPSEEQQTLLKSIPKEQIKNLTNKAMQIAQKKSMNFKSKAKEEASKLYQAELDRVKSMNLEQSDHNARMKLLRKEESDIQACIENSQLLIDALRVILPSN